MFRRLAIDMGTHKAPVVGGPKLPFRGAEHCQEGALAVQHLGRLYSVYGAFDPLAHQRVEALHPTVMMPITADHIALQQCVTQGLEAQMLTMALQLA